MHYHLQPLSGAVLLTAASLCVTIIISLCVTEGERNEQSVTVLVPKFVLLGL